MTTNLLHHAAHPKSLLCILTAVCGTDVLMRRKRDLTQGVGLKEMILLQQCASHYLPLLLLDPSLPLAPGHLRLCIPAQHYSAVSRPALPPSGQWNSFFKLRSVLQKRFQVEISATSVLAALQLRLLVWAQWQSRALLAGGGRHFLVGRSGKSELNQTPTSPSTQAIYIKNIYLKI